MTPQERLAALAAIVRQTDDDPAAFDELTGILQPEFLLIHRRVVRPDDLFVGDFIFPNLRLEGTGAARRLVRARAAEPAGIRLLLQGQAIVEDTVGSEEAPRRGLFSALSGPSNLVFRMPEVEPSLAFTLEAILDACRRWSMVLDRRAARDLITGPGGVSGGIALGQIGVAAGDLGGVIRAVSATLDAAGQGNVRRAIMGAARRAVGDQGGGANSEVDAISRTLDSDTRDVARALFDLTRAAASTGAGLGGADDFLDPSAPIRPGRDVSYIEAPYRLFVSPQTGARWHHQTAPVTANGRTELWHTRLVRRAPLDPNRDPLPNPIRVIWSTAQVDGPNGALAIPSGNNDMGLAMTEANREALVALTAARPTPSADGFQPSAIPTKRLVLSALGAGIDLEGNWPVRPQGADVSAWRHVSNFARDHYVRIVEEGVLFPFGHRAALTSISERKFNRTGADDDVVAYLEKRQFIVIREQLRQFPFPGQINGGRGLPFREVEILDRITPDIVVGTGQGTEGRVEFVERAGSPFRFSLRMVDMGGFEHTTDLPMMFIAQSDADDPSFVQDLSDDYHTVDAALREMAFGGAEMQIVERPADQAGDVTLPTETVRLSAQPRIGEAADREQTFAPAFQRMRVAIASVSQLAPDALSSPTQDIAFLDRFLEGGLGANNPGEFFAQLIDENGAPALLDLSFGGTGASTEDAGGMIAPDMGIGALSATLGSVGDLESVLNEAIPLDPPMFSPAEFFGNARLLGAIPIRDLFQGISLFADGPDAPEIKTIPLTDPPGTETRLSWVTQLTSTAVPIFVPRAGGLDTILDLEVCQITRLTGSEGQLDNETRIAADITNFKLNLIGCLILWFDRLEYEKLPGSEARVDPTLHPENAVVFGGPLEFVNRLSDILPDTGLGGASVDISPVGIVAGFDLAIPNVQVGVLALTNMAVGLRLSLPFDGSPVTLRFGFAEREDPFNISVSLLGGGGFFALALGTDGVREVEAALEFGACIAFDIGIASGGACVLVGIYFRWGLNEQGDEEVELTGYLEISGELSVLGLIRVSIVFYLAFTYEKDEAAGMATVWGIATVTVEVEVLFFSTSVELTVERRLGGSPADPGFLDFIPNETEWQRYAAAFA